MPHPVLVRPIQQSDFRAWELLWEGYNAFYGRSDQTALPRQVTEATWQRFFDPAEPVFALVSESQGKLVGLVHYPSIEAPLGLSSPATCRICSPHRPRRGRGIGKALIEGVHDQARSAGLKQVYWQTHVSNAAGRLLYDKVATHSGFIVYSRDL